MMKLFVAAALAFVPVQSSKEVVASPAPAAQSSAIAQYYVPFGTTCSLPTVFGPVPSCRLVAPLPLGSDCFCIGDPRLGFVTR